MNRSTRCRAAAVVLVVVAVLWPAVAHGQGATTTTTPTATAPTTTAPTSTSTVTSTTGAPSTGVPATTTTEPGTEGPGSPNSPSTMVPSAVAELRALSADYADLSDEELELMKRYLAVAQQAAELTHKVDELNLHVSTGQAELAQAQGRLEVAEARVRDLSRQLQVALADLERERQQLRGEAVSAYIGGDRHGTNGSADAFAHASSMNDLGTTIVYAGAIVSDRQAIIRRVVDRRSDVERLQAEADAAVQQAVTTRDQVAGRQGQVQTMRDQVGLAQLAMTDQAQRNQQLLQEVSTKRAAFGERIAAIMRVSDTISSALAFRQLGQNVPVLTTGIFLSPIKDPKFNSAFGPRIDPVLGGTGVHNGVDINGAMGTPIRAPADAVVVSAGDISGYGNCTVLDHGGGLGTLYGHQSVIAVTAGQVVRRGDVIGYVGSTGKSTGPHLHWEVRRFGQPIDPIPFIGPG